MSRIAVFLLVSMTSWAVYAHHSVAAFYDSDSAAEISGTIASIDWVNPHIRFTLETTDNEVWAVESGSVNMLERNGVGREHLTVGNEITVAGRLSRHGQNGMYAGSIRTREGEVIALSGLVGGLGADGPGPQAPTGADPDGIFRVWTKGVAYGDVANNSATGLTLPYAPAAVAARAGYDPLTDDTALRCIPQGMPGIMDNPFPMQIAEQDGDIVLRMEEWDVVRTIHMSADENPNAQPATPQGYSVGRWEEGALVVETTRIDWPFFDDVGTPQSADIEVQERFSLNADESRLNYEITVTDLVTFTEPFTLNGYWIWVPGEEIKPYNCTL